MVLTGMLLGRFFPGAIYYLSAWYNKSELGKRIAALYIAQQFGNAFGGLFAAAVFKLDGSHGIRAWQWLCTSTTILMSTTSIDANSSS